ncbi:MAG: polyprenyl diphosphate synthase [Bacteriovorax sp.]|nr:polyprenyl diphosphate synthase [Bacteriovorax sp.]
MAIKKVVPNHVAFLTGGNESWAIERNLSILDGHKKGYEKIKIMPSWLFSRGVKVVSVLAFSSDDWKRPPEEVNSLMKFLKQLFCENLEEFKRNDWRIVMTGKIDELPGDLPEVCAETQRETQDGKKGILNICINYNGREEILQAIKKMIANNLQAEQIHEGIIRKYLYNSGIDDPNLIIGFGGVQNLLGFQLWQAEKSEIIFLKKDWPDFEPLDVENFIEEFSKRRNEQEEGQE